MTREPPPEPLQAEPVAVDARFASALGATTVEAAKVHLPSNGRTVYVPAYVRTEVNWTDPLPRQFSAIPNKRAYALDGVPLYPELLVVRLLERAGWGAAWRKTWGGDAYWRDINQNADPSGLALTIIDQVSRQAGHGASWDIVAWRERELRLFSSRRAGGQRVSAYMADWLDAALRLGIPLGCFALVEHHSTTRAAPRRRF